MKVLLKKDVDNLGYAGEVYEVADGYGRNYLLPQGFAEKATPKVLKEAEHWRKQADARREQLLVEHEALAKRVEAVRLTFLARAGETGKLYGSITTTQVTDALNKELGTDIDRRKVGSEPLRLLGEHDVVVRLSKNYQPRVKVFIVDEEEALAADEEEAGEELIVEGAPALEIEDEDAIEAAELDAEDEDAIEAAELDAEDEDAIEAAELDAEDEEAIEAAELDAEDEEAIEATEIDAEDEEEILEEAADLEAA